MQLHKTGNVLLASPPPRDILKRYLADLEHGRDTLVDIDGSVYSVYGTQHEHWGKLCALLVRRAT